MPAGPVASAVMSAGTVITGAVVSCTVTWNDECDLFPAPSVAVQLTVVGPLGKVAPDGGVQLTGTLPSTRSVAVGLCTATAAPAGLV